MFDFLYDLGNYDERAIARYEDGKLIVDTARVSDGKQPYETAVAHPEYNEGHWVIVQAYDTPEEAEFGHNVWVGVMTADELPSKLVDCKNSATADAVVAIGGEDELTFPRTIDSTAMDGTKLLTKGD